MRMILFLMLMIAGLPAHAVEPEGGRPFVDWMARELGLDAPTVEAMRRIADEARADAAAPQAAAAEARQALRALLEAPEPDEATVMAQVDAVGELERQAWKARLRGLMRMRKLLTPAQRETLADLQRRRVVRTMLACRDDARTHCADAVGPAARMACLLERQGELSGGCREALQSRY